MESAHPQSLQDFVPTPDVPDVKSNTSGNTLGTEMFYPFWSGKILFSTAQTYENI